MSGLWECYEPEDDAWADLPDDMQWQWCPTCRGCGTVNPLTAPPGFLCITIETCPTCEGTGEAL